MKKKYNPFKMWGSYLGAILWFAFTFFKMKFYQCFTSDYIMIWSSAQAKQIVSELGYAQGQCLMPLFTIFLLFSIIGGFLIGWLINSLWRKFIK